MGGLVFAIIIMFVEKKLITFENMMFPGKSGSRGDAADSAGWSPVLGRNAEHALEFCSLVDE